MSIIGNSKALHDLGNDLARFRLHCPNPNNVTLTTIPKMPLNVTAHFCASCTKMRLCVCATRAWQHDPNCKPTKQQQRSRHCLLCFGHRQNAAPILIRFFSAHITREDSSILEIGHVPTWPGLGRLVCLGGQTSTLEDIRQGQGQAPGLPPGHVETLELPEARR